MNSFGANVIQLLDAMETRSALRSSRMEDRGGHKRSRYFNEAVNGRLLNEFLKEHGQVQQLKATVARQQEEIYATIAQQ
jgi:hypothetical protein